MGQILSTSSLQRRPTVGGGGGKCLLRVWLTFVYVSKDPLFLRRSNSSSLLLQYTSCRSKRDCSFVLLPPMKEMGVALEPRAETRASADVSRRLRAQTVALRPSSNLILSPVLLVPSSLCHFVAS